MARQKYPRVHEIEALGGKDIGALQIVEVGVDAIRPYGGNPRDNENAVKPVAASIEEFGFQAPVLLDGDGTLLAGHTRLKAAKELGLKTVPAIYITGLTPVEARAYRLADNRAGAINGWDVGKLKDELKALKGKFRMERFGFGKDELEALRDEFRVDAMGEGDVDAEIRHRVKPGDVWRLGEHRLVCGDGTNGITCTEALRGEFAAACVSRPRTGDRARTEKLMRQAIVQTDGSVLFHLKPGFLSWARPAWEEAGGVWSTFIVNTGGEEPGPTMPHAFSAWLYGWNRLRKHWFIGERGKADAWEFRDTGRASASLQITGEAIANSTTPGRTVFDPSAGDGDTLIAAEMACRRAVCIEDDPEACARIIARWEAFTHREAGRDG